MINVFISYSHESEEHSERVRALSNRLVEDGIDCILDQYVDSPPEGWPMWVDKQLAKSDYVLVICTETYFKRVSDSDNGKGRGVKWESTISYQQIYECDSKNQKFIPVVFTPEDAQYIPTPLQGVIYYSVDSEGGYLKLYRRLTGQPRVEKPTLGKIKYLSPLSRTEQAAAPSLSKISLHKLPVTGASLFGRERELALLDEAWEDEHTNTVIIRAWGGVGKTSLINHWLNRMAQQDFKGAKRVYGWSFYSQGAGEGKQVSADEFMQETLKWFDDNNPTYGPTLDKGRRLAALIKKEKTLLILHGIEPLQYSPNLGYFLDGKLKDIGLKVLLKELSVSQPGLCIITTRVKIADLESHINNTVKEIQLVNLSNEAGQQLLKSLGVIGTEKDILAAVKEYEGHALALTLLGHYLTSVHDGDVRQRDKISELAIGPGQGAHARRVIQSYENWLDGSPELDILRMMGLFDRPAKKGAVDALIAKPAIPGMTDKLQDLSETEWYYALSRLRKLNLLSNDDPEQPGSLDCHPLVREHFAKRTSTQIPEGWRLGHQRLYHYYKNLPKKELPDTLEEMEPLFSAVAHGCNSGLHQEIFEGVYSRRIRREGQAYIVKQLGAFGADLAVLSHFFEMPWEQLQKDLTDYAKSYVLSWTAFDLRALGRLKEAVHPMQMALEISLEKEDWEGASIDAVNLSQLMLILGQVKDAVMYGMQCVQHADLSENKFQQEVSRTTLANALHQSGKITEAEQLFREAEEIQKTRQPQFHYLYSLRGYQYCDLLLDNGKYREVIERSKQILDVANKHLGLLDIALGHLSLGRARLMLEKDINDKGGRDRIYDSLDQAVAGFREAGFQHHLLQGLLARAAAFRLKKEFARAWSDLYEAKEIAELGGFNLYLVDYHIEAGHMHLAENRKKDAGKHFSKAKVMSEEMGYQRRKHQLKAFEIPIPG